MRRKLLLCVLLVAIIATAVGCRQPAGLPKVQASPAFLPSFGWNEALVYKRIPFFPTGTLGKLPKNSKVIAKLQRDTDFYGKHLAKGAKVWWALEPVAGAQAWQPMAETTAGAPYRSGEAFVLFIKEASLFVRDKNGDYLRLSAAGFEPDFKGKGGYAVTADLESQRRMTVSYSTWDRSIKRKRLRLELGEYALLEKRSGKVIETYYADGQMPSDKALRILSSRRFWRTLPFYPWRTSQKKRAAATLASWNANQRDLLVTFEVPVSWDVTKSSKLGSGSRLAGVILVVGPHSIREERNDVRIEVLAGERVMSLGGGRRRRILLAGKHQGIERKAQDGIEMTSRIGETELRVYYFAPKNLQKDYVFAYRDLIKSLTVKEAETRDGKK